MGKKKDSIKLLKAQNKRLRAEIEMMKNILEIKDRQISVLNEIAILESEITGEKDARNRLMRLTKCCCEFE